MITLFYAPGTCALASHIALEDAGATYKVEKIDIRSGQQRSDAFLKVNPKGRVPALVTGRGILTETPALLAYIAQTFPAAELAPLHDPFAFARVQEFNLFLCSTLHVAHAHRMRGHRWADDEATIEGMRRAVPRTVGECWTLIETRMFTGPWVMGPDYTICDPYLFTLAQWMEGDGIDPSLFPKVADHRQRMAERPNVRKAVAAEV
jgi:glutathione S-transferase